MVERTLNRSCISLSDLKSTQICTKSGKKTYCQLFRGFKIANTKIERYSVCAHGLYFIFCCRSSQPSLWVKSYSSGCERRVSKNPNANQTIYHYPLQNYQRNSLANCDMTNFAQQSELQLLTQRELLRPGAPEGWRVGCPIESGHNNLFHHTVQTLL